MSEILSDSEIQSLLDKASSFPWVRDDNALGGSERTVCHYGHCIVCATVTNQHSSDVRGQYEQQGDDLDLIAAAPSLIAHLLKRAQDAEAKVKSSKELDQAHVEYEALLCEELTTLASFANTHGWKSSKYEDGKACRNRIDLARTALEK